jgi:putative transposase
MLKRERLYRRCYRSHAEAYADIFDYVERFYNPNRRRRMVALETAKNPLTQLSVEMG